MSSEEVQETDMPSKYLEEFENPTNGEYIPFGEWENFEQNKAYHTRGLNTRIAVIGYDKEAETGFLAHLTTEDTDQRIIGENSVPKLEEACEYLENNSDNPEYTVVGGLSPDPELYQAIENTLDAEYEVFRAVDEEGNVDPNIVFDTQEGELYRPDFN